MEDSADITIDFPYQAGVPELDNERTLFWESPKTIKWFERHGYYLYETLEDMRAIPRLPISEEGCDYPYGAYNTRLTEERGVPLRAPPTGGRVAFAQDSQNRHVAIKLVRADTDEHRILEFIKQQPLETIKANCVIPVLDILPITGFCFVVMPRWGRAIHYTRPATMKEILQMMLAMLKGVNFLHQNNIVHRDIKIPNFVIDEFGDDARMRDPLRAHRRATGAALYAIFDFDCSLKVPDGQDRRDYWITTEGAYGSYDVTMDYAQGELEYNPFITDVGALGVALATYYQYLTPGLPMLAPLLDKLTTHRLDERFTTSEAISFFEEMYSTMTEEELMKPTWDKESPKDDVCWDDYDRWTSVPPEFSKKWAHYRTPPVSLWTKALRKACEYPWIQRRIKGIRLSSRQASKLLRAISSYIPTVPGTKR